MRHGAEPNTRHPGFDRNAIASLLLAADANALETLTEFERLFGEDLVQALHYAFVEIPTQTPLRMDELREFRHIESQLFASMFQGALAEGYLDERVILFRRAQSLGATIPSILYLHCSYMTLVHRELTRLYGLQNERLLKAFDVLARFVAANMTVAFGVYGASA